MRRYLLQLSRVAVLAAALAGNAACGGSGPAASGAAGSGGGGSGGSAGTASAGVAGIGGGGDAGVGGAGDVAGAGGSIAQSPEEIHDSLLNAPTTGGLTVSRTPPTVSYPTCQ